jgi:hypothetical protein
VAARTGLIGLLCWHFGDSFHMTYPPGAFQRLNAYQPVGRVGKTILLYYISEDRSPSPQKFQPENAQHRRQHHENAEARSHDAAITKAEACNAAINAQAASPECLSLQLSGR